MRRKAGCGSLAPIWPALNNRNQNQTGCADLVDVCACQGIRMVNRWHLRRVQDRRRSAPEFWRLRTGGAERRQDHQADC